MREEDKTCTPCGWSHLWAENAECLWFGEGDAGVPPGGDAIERRATGEPPGDDATERRTRVGEDLVGLSDLLAADNEKTAVACTRR